MFASNIECHAVSGTFQSSLATTMVQQSSGIKSLGETRIATILIKFQDAVDNNAWINGEKVATPDRCRDLLFDSDASVNAFIQEASYGKAWLTGDVFGPYVVPANTPTYQDNSSCLLFDDVVAAAGADIDFGRYDVILILYPRTRINNGEPIDICGFQGYAGTELAKTEDGEWPFDVIWINGYLDLHIVAHELGHIFGLGHAHGYRPGAGQGPNREISRFFSCGDPYNVMGYNSAPGYAGPGHYGARDKYNMRWFDESNVLEITEFGTYRVTISPLEISTDALQTVILPRSMGAAYYLEFRRPIGFDKALQNLNGLMIQWGATNRMASGTRRVYTQRHPDAFALPVGHTFYDDFANVQVTPLSLNESGIVLEIMYGLPNLSLAIDASNIPHTIRAGQPLEIPFTLSNNTPYHVPDSTFLALRIRDDSGRDTLILQKTAPLKSGKQRAEQIKWQSTKNSKSVSVSLIADYYDQITEAGESDNKAPSGSGFQVVVSDPLLTGTINDKDESGEQITILGNHPNPFNSATTMHFKAPQQSRATLIICNARGKIVRKFEMDIDAAGRHTVTWDGLNALGQPVASGLYFYRLAVKHADKDHFAMKKMSLVR